MPTRREDLLASMVTYRAARREFLSAIGIPASNRDPLAEFSEHLVAELLGGRLADSRVQKGYDLIDDAGGKTQVRYVANPKGEWINGHVVVFDDALDVYALVIVEALEPVAVICFDREHLAAVCGRLGKRHPNQDRSLQLTGVNVRSLLSDPASFRPFGVRIWQTPEWIEQ